MGIYRSSAVFGVFASVSGFLLLTACVTYPYQTAFDACDREAGACYRNCEQSAAVPEEYDACHADCEAVANRCFTTAYNSYSYSGGAYYTSAGYASWPWRGRYGAWGPTRGYYFDFTYFNRYPSVRLGYSYDDYSWRSRRARRSGRDHDGHRKARRYERRRNSNDDKTDQNIATAAAATDTPGEDQAVNAPMTPFEAVNVRAVIAL